MKKNLLVLAAVCLSALSMSAKVIVYYGTSKVVNNTVYCTPTVKVCAVVIILGPEWPEGNKIQIFGKDGAVVSEHKFRTIRESRQEGTTALTWLP